MRVVVRDAAPVVYQRLAVEDPGQLVNAAFDTGTGYANGSGQKAASTEDFK
jgi:hypothetical protein